MQQLPFDIKMRRDHVAIMRRSWGLLEKLLNGKKTLESRWHENKSLPWGKVFPGDTIYFKNAGERVLVKATASEVIQLENLNQDKIRSVLKQYGKADGIALEMMEEFFNYFRFKKYCVLIFLKDIRKVKPFEIKKDGFGNMSAWITVKNIEDIKEIKSNNFKQVSLLKNKK